MKLTNPNSNTETHNLVINIMLVDFSNQFPPIMLRVIPTNSEHLKLENSQLLEWAFKQFNHEGDYEYTLIMSSTTRDPKTLRSLSIGDMVSINRINSPVKAFKCMPEGWQTLI